MQGAQIRKNDRRCSATQQIDFSRSRQGLPFLVIVPIKKEEAQAENSSKLKLIFIASNYQYVNKLYYNYYFLSIALHSHPTVLGLP
jgi:hypothetical protein